LIFFFKGNNHKEIVTMLYTLSEAAERWGKPENDILRMVMADDIWTAWADLHTSGSKIDANETPPRKIEGEIFYGLFRIPPQSIAVFLVSQGVNISIFTKDKGERVVCFPEKPVFVLREQLLIKARPDGTTQDLPNCLSDTDLKGILDQQHPWHSELLAIAVKGWMELYSNREGNSSDNAHKPTGGHIAMIEKWLSDQKSALLTKTSTEYLGKVINPSKSGGPNKTQG
jgi:hypothetical protein